jgi:hypothetical protein
MFGLTSYQYTKVKKEFEAPAPSTVLGSSGVFQKADGSDNYLIYIKEPDDAPWYDDQRLQMVGAATGLLGAMAGGLVGYGLNKGGQKEMGQVVNVHFPTGGALAPTYRGSGTDRTDNG